MIMKKTKLSKGLKRLFAATIIVAALYIIVFVLFALVVNKQGDNDLYSFAGVIRFHLNGVMNLLLFNYGKGSTYEIAYFALSVFLYALLVCWIIFLIAGIAVNDKKNTNIMAYPIVMSFIAFCLYVALASGLQKYWAIINQADPLYQGRTVVLFLVIVMVALVPIYFLLSIVFYFWCMLRAYIAGKNLDQDDDALIEEVRKVVKEELANNQPYNVVMVPTEPKQEEPVKEEEPLPEPEPEPEPEPIPQPEPVKQEEVKVEEKREWPQVSFWDKAREVWPQLDNPRPLLKEEKTEEVPQEANDEWNRNKRQPFLNRVITADLDTKANYNELKNELLSYGVKSRLSRGGDTFRLGGKEYAKIYLVGKTLKVYLALSPEDYKDSTIPIEDVGHRPNYAGMPLLFKVRSGLSVRRCKELIKAACEKDGLTQKEVGDTNWVDELRQLNAEKAEKAKDKKAE